jgi:hypothetical protein
MLTKFNDSNDMNTLASDTINSYIEEGYRIDAKESVIDREKDDDCIFKAALKKDVDGIECKTVITLSDNGDDKNKHCTYHKVETVGDTKCSEETRTFSYSCACKHCDKPNRCGCKCPSAFTKLDDYIKLNSGSEDESAHIKVNADDSEDDIYNKIVNRKKNLKEASEVKVRANKQEENDDELEDSLIKVVRYIFGL